MSRDYRITFFVLTILTLLIGIVGSVAANQISEVWQPYLWLAWPIWLALFAAILLVEMKAKGILKNMPSARLSSKQVVFLVKATIVIVIIILMLLLGVIIFRRSFYAMVIQFGWFTPEQVDIFALWALTFAFVLILGALTVSLKQVEITPTTESESPLPQPPLKPPQESAENKNTPTIPEAPIELKKHGFNFDPFVFWAAEEIPEALVEEVLQEIYVDNKQVDEHLEKYPNRSLIILDPRGSGKTFTRYRLQTKLQNSLIRKDDALNLEDEPVALVVPHIHFGQNLLNKLPNIKLQDHTEPILTAIAEALCIFISARPKQFLNCDSTIRARCWGFIRRHLGKKPESVLQKSDLYEDLYQDWTTIHESENTYQQSDRLDEILAELLTWFSGIGVNRIFILIDGVDGYPETNDAPQLQGALVNPILNTGTLFANAKLDVTWKIFLSDTVRDIVIESFGVRTGRIDVIPISWDWERLQDLLQFRLEWASNGVVDRMAKLFDEQVEIDIDRAMARMAMRHKYLGPPRFLLKLGDELVRILSSHQKTFLAYDDWIQVREGHKANLVPLVQILHPIHSKSWAENLGGDLISRLTGCRVDSQEVELADLVEHLTEFSYEAREGDHLLLVLSEKDAPLFENLEALSYRLKEIAKRGVQVTFITQTDINIPSDISTEFPIIEFNRNYQNGVELLVRLVMAESHTGQLPDLGLIGVLRANIENALLRCGPFESDRTLKSTFIDKRLFQWQDQLPEATNREERVKSVMDFLFIKRSNGVNGLALFLQVVGEGKHLHDDCRQILLNLAGQIDIGASY